MKKKKLSKLKTALVAFVEDIKRHESGIVLYEVFQEKDDSTTLVHVMTFKDKKAETAHVKSTHVKKWIKTLHSICKENPEVTDLKLVRSIKDLKEPSSDTSTVQEPQQ
ncbi:MAG: antibiotic biosynthesis monooxygenase [Thaumarchaeota archaeon]|nr:antibiotic biosynthesis monooxygenase [Nitrososphaerota archaeon]